MEDIRDIIEALLFVTEEPLTVDKLKTIVETVETKEIKEALQALSDQYDARGGGFRLYEVAGGWQLRSRPQYNAWIKRMLQPSPQRLSKPALETLAIIAYNQPIIRADVEHIRGVDCGGVLRQLMERKLVRVLGRKEIPGRPLIYATTKLFLEIFGLKDLKDLPSPKEIEEMTSAMESPDAKASPSEVPTEAFYDTDPEDTFAAVGARTFASSRPEPGEAPSRDARQLGHVTVPPPLNTNTRRICISGNIMTPRPTIRTAAFTIDFTPPAIGRAKAAIGSG